MFKNIVAPVQAWLLVQGRCVGCGTPLKEGLSKKKDAQMRIVTCKKCSRIFIYDVDTQKYRRALPTEV